MTKTLRLVMALALALIVPMSIAVPGASARHRSGNIFQRHRGASSVAAGIAAYHIAKHTGRNRAAHGGHRNFAQRHPMISGIGAAVLTHHILKHHTHARR